MTHGKKAKDFWPHVYDDLTLDGNCQEDTIWNEGELLERMIQLFPGEVHTDGGASAMRGSR